MTQIIKEPGNQADTDMLTAALSLAKDGAPVFPCTADATPYTAHGFKDATTDPAIIRQIWTKWPDALLALPTGSASTSTVALAADVEDVVSTAVVSGFTELSSGTYTIVTDSNNQFIVTDPNIDAAERGARLLILHRSFNASLGPHRRRC